MLKNLLMFLELAIDEEEQFVPDTNSSVEEGAGDNSTEQPGTEDSGTETEEQPIVPSEFDIDGEKVTAEQIKEWKRGNMRQSDYTRKTQEIAALKKEATEAMELYNYLKANPEVARKLAEESPEQKEKVTNIMNPDLQQINLKLSTMEIERSIERIKSSDKDFDEIAVLELANQRRITVDDAYDIWRGRNVDKIIEKRLKEQSTDITKKIKTNNEITKSMINNRTKPVDNFNLTDKEIEMAGKLNMSAEEYAKWKL